MVERADADLVGRWRDLLACYSTVSCALDRALQEAHGIGMSEFEALDRIVESGREHFRMHELADCMYLSQSALSRTVARLERAGFVNRTMCVDDRRAIYVAVTDAGRQKHAEAHTTHLSVLAQKLAPEPARI